MDEFKPEDELKPDASDRRPVRPRKPSSANRAPAPRQRVMMGIGILVLLLMVIGIGSALKDNNDKSANIDNNSAAGVTATQGGVAKNIDLSVSSSTSGNPGDATPTATSGTPDISSTNDGMAPQKTLPADGSSPQQLSPPAISSTPTESKSHPIAENQHRIELQGNLNNALNNQQNSVDDAASAAQGGSAGTLPTAPATVAAGAAHSSTSRVSGTSQSSLVKPSTERAKHHSHRSASAHQAKPAAKSASGKAHNEQSALRALPSGNYTLQLSGASREGPLNAWAKTQNLTGYHIYKTTRNGQPWYVLITGSFATPAEAKRAVASLPAGVRAQDPWVKPLNQLKK
ncbi:DamX protein [Izhakiella capsodis]|uniref:DamX protein n=1 Tax=Izhakiella capsodis TaxID=1367852 RepID=A0A1I4Z0T2_9GAMM|nr:SPOR domain-containing protein [Izhakiella capsodis]SFN43569.1 DamX protein [Izhakiella capsodis]